MSNGKLQLLLSKYKRFQLWLVIFLMPVEVQGHTVPHLKSLRYGIYETRRLSCGSVSSICQDILKSVNLLHKLVFVKTQSWRTVLTHGNALSEWNKQFTYFFYVLMVLCKKSHFYGSFFLNMDLKAYLIWMIPKRPL